MKTGEKKRTTGGDAGTAPFFSEEAEEEARPVVPLGWVSGPESDSRPARGKWARNLTLALAVIAAGAAGAAGGYLALTTGAAESAAEATGGVAPEAHSPQTAPGNSRTDPAGAERSRRAVGESLAREEPETPRPKEPEGHGRSGDERAEHALREAERRREAEEKLAERRREEEEKRAERRRDEEEREKPKARLVGTLSERPGL